MLLMFGDVELFVENNLDLGQATRSRMLAILQNQQKKAAPMVEMAILIDVGKIFVQTTYNLEGDSPLILDCFEKLEAVSRSIQMKQYPTQMP